MAARGHRLKLGRRIVAWVRRTRRQSLSRRPVRAKAQPAVGFPDLLIGSFSKTFASNGGFVAMKDAVKEYLKMYSCPQTFSNALSPIQVAIVRAALGIVKSSEGATRRKQLHENSVYLREQLTRNGFACLGEPSAIGPVFLGEDGPARVLWRTLSDKGVASNFVEFPGVATNGARIRMRVQCTPKRMQTTSCAISW
jgi:glycine C-acetyltransferase